MNERTAFRVMGIDPGVANLGVAVLDYDEETDTYKIITAFTMVSVGLLRKSPHLSDALTERGAKLFLLEQELVRVMCKYEPEAVASEAPFLGRFPQAFASLVECLVSIRRAYFTYKPYLMLTSIDPPNVKVSFDVKGNSNDKEEMRESLKLKVKNNEINMGGINIDDLDEHAVDAIAVAVCKMKMLLGTHVPFERKKKGRRGKRK